MNKTHGVAFHKMHGCGNDFILIDNRALRVPVPLMAGWAVELCRRAFGVGADGLIFLEDSETPEAAYRWHFYNADGSRAEMCGNASRCVGRLAVELGMAPPEHAFLSDAGLIRVRLLGEDLVKVQLTPPKDTSLNIALNVAGQELTAHYVDSGVPHAVVFFEDVSGLDIMTLGPALRHHGHFAPRGANANLAQVVDGAHMMLRTYERGVEGETHACGTGAVAAVHLAHALGLTGSRVDVTTSGKEVLTIDIENSDVFLTGTAIQVYTGELRPQALGLSLG